MADALKKYLPYVGWVFAILLFGAAMNAFGKLGNWQAAFQEQVRENERLRVETSSCKEAVAALQGRSDALEADLKECRTPSPTPSLAPNSTSQAPMKTKKRKR